MPKPFLACMEGDAYVMTPGPVLSEIWRDPYQLWMPPCYRRRVLTMPIGLVFESASLKICIAFGLLRGDDGSVSYIQSASIRLNGRWHGWNWMWTSQRGCIIRIYDQWATSLAEIPMALFVPKAFYMTDKSIVQHCDDTEVVQECDESEWTIVYM